MFTGCNLPRGQAEVGGRRLGSLHVDGHSLLAGGTADIRGVQRDGLLAGGVEHNHRLLSTHRGLLGTGGRPIPLYGAG